MKLLLIALLALATSCASSNTINRSGTGGTVQRVEIRIENNNWNQARVYLLPGSGLTGKQRIATVPALVKEKVFIRLISPTFRFYVTLLSVRSRWVSSKWEDQYSCFEIVIHNYLPHSYVLPCTAGRER